MNTNGRGEHATGYLKVVVLPLIENWLIADVV
jgi:hypothetical protein